MANNDLGIRFSNNIYATRQDVMTQMKIPIVDNIWKQICDYRNYFHIILSLKHIDGNSYSVCLTPIISQKINELERKLMRAMINYSNLNKANKIEFSKACYHDILSSIAKKYNSSGDESIIDKIIDKDYDSVQPKDTILCNYLTTLEYIGNNYIQEINEDFFGTMYSILLGTSDLTEFYRNNEIDNSYNKVVINKVYIGLPVNAIEPSMNTLINFVKNSTCSLFVKACSAYYYIYYIRPFEYYSEEMGCLLFKEILKLNDVEEVAPLFNFEKIFNNREENEKMIIESQKTHDLTYFINLMLNKFNAYLDEFLNKLVLEKKKQIIDENYVSDEEETTSKSSEQKSQVKESSSSSVAPTNSNTTQQVNAYNVPINYTQNIAITNLSEGLTEDQAQKFETHLKEKYPDLSQSQAYFYARHCTLGMKYTIAQFKKALNCAYETARTSMDGLVSLGFYRKENLKNKFIYIPVKRN